MVLLALAVRGDPAKGASTNAGRASANLAISMTIGGAECLFRGSSRRHSLTTSSQRRANLARCVLWLFL